VTIGSIVFLGTGFLLLLIWVIYPLSVAAVAKGARGRRAHETGGAPDPAPPVTVVVASRESTEALRRRVENLRASTYPAEALQIVVAYDWRAPLPADLAAMICEAGAEVVRGDPPGGKAAALNAGVRCSRGDILVFTDTFQRFQPSAITNLVVALQPLDIGAVSGLLRLPVQRRSGLMHDYWTMEIALRRNEAALYSTVGVFGPIWAMHRRLWKDLAPGLILDDVHTPMRLVMAGWRIGFAEDAVAIDLRPPTIPSEFRRKVRTQTGILQMIHELPGVLDPGRNPLWLPFYLHKLGRLATAPLALFTVLGGISWFASGHDDLPQHSLLALLAVLVLVGVVPPLRHRMVSVLLWAGSMCGALLVAIANGVRREWDVWR
jgi:biofilm PGA synthesis N-glycosyltransferase PgaC